MKAAFLLAAVLSSAIFAHADTVHRRLGNWWWWPADGYNAEVCDPTLDEMQNGGVTEIYFYCGEDIMSGNWEPVHGFVQKAMAHGMRVAVLYDDWPDFDTDGGKAFTNSMAKQFLAYREEYPDDDLYGIHFDIELNKSGGYNATSLQHYCDAFIDKIQSARAQGIHCEVDVGCGWGNQGGASATYGGETGIYNVIARYTDTVAMMSYRDTASEILSFANQSGALDACIAKGREFLLGVETDDAGEGDKVDFCAEDKTYLFEEIDKTYGLIAEKAGSVPYGMAIHQNRSFMKLKGYIPDGYGRNSLLPDGSTTVHFDGNGATGGEMTPQLFTAGVARQLTANAFVKDGFCFMGWSANAEGRVDYADGETLKDFSTAHHVTFTAVWCSLGQAADMNGKAWTTDAAAPWKPTFAESHDGKASVVSGAASAKAPSRLSVGVKGPGELAFLVRTRLASDQARLTVSAGDVVVTQFVGNVDWRSVTVPVADGVTSVTWTLENPASASADANRAWIDEASWTPVKAPGSRHRIGCFWDSASDADEPTCTRYLDLLRRAGVTEIYFGDTSKVVKNDWSSLHEFIRKAMSRGMRVAILSDYWEDFVKYDGLYLTDKLVPAMRDYLKAYPDDDLYGIVFDYEPYKPDTSKFQEYCDLLLPKAQIARQSGLAFEVTARGDYNSQGGADAVFEGTRGIYDILAKNVDGVILNAYWDTEAKIMDAVTNSVLSAALSNRCDVVVGVKASSTGKNHESFADNDKETMFAEMDKVFADLDAMKLPLDYGMSIDNVSDFFALAGDIPDGNGRNEGFEEGTCTVSFDGNGATDGEMANLVLTNGVAAVLPRCAFVKTGFDFIGWSTNGSAEVVYSDEATILDPTDDRALALYAVWKLIPRPPRPKSAHRRIGNWWWHSSDGYEEPTCTQYLDELQKACVSEIYFYGYSSLKAEEREQLHTFVRKAMAHGMRVAIMYDDWPDFSQDGGDYFVNKLIPSFLEYRKAYPDDAVYGFHFDIEPGSYSQSVLQSYCDLFLEKVQLARAEGIHCEVDVPCGWNSQGGKNVEFRGTKGIYNIVSLYTDTVAFMSYRDVAQKIVDFANLAALPAAVENGCDFLVGVETADSGEGDAVDFHAEDKPYLFGEMDKVFDLLDGMNLDVGYGMAIHQTRAFYALPGAVPEGNGRNTWGIPVAPEYKSVAFGAVGDERRLTLGETVPGVQYTLFVSTEVTGPYVAAADSVPCLASGTGPVEFELPDLGEKGFYRVTAGSRTFKSGDGFPDSDF